MGHIFGHIFRQNPIRRSALCDDLRTPAFLHLFSVDQVSSWSETTSIPLPFMERRIWRVVGRIVFLCDTRTCSLWFWLYLFVWLLEEITFEETVSPQSVAIYSDALIKCRASGNPAPVVSWRLKGHRLSSGVFFGSGSSQNVSSISNVVFPNLTMNYNDIKVHRW